MKLSGEVKVFGGLLLVAGVLVGITVVPSLIPHKDPFIVTTKPADPVTIARLIPTDAHIIGPKDAKFTVVVFSDFQCPQCKQSAPALDSAVKSRKDLRMIYRHFQARPDHMNSALLAQAAEAAGYQGKFWEMHDAMFEKQDDLKIPNQDTVRVNLAEIAVKLKLDLKKFQTDLMSEKAKKTFQRDMETGIDDHIPGTPTYYIIRPNKDMVRMSQQEDIAAFLRDPENYVKPAQPGDPVK